MAPVTDEELQQRLRANVRRLRSAAALPVRVVCGRVKMHLRHWQKIESAEVNATLQTLVRLGAALGVDPMELITRPSGERTSAPSRRPSSAPDRRGVPHEEGRSMSKATPKTDGVSLQLTDEQAAKLEALSEKLSRGGQRVSRHQAATYALTRALDAIDQMTPAERRALLRAKR